MSNNSIIEHRGSYHFVPLREEFLVLCQNCVYKKPDTAKSKNKASPHCKAFILAILESWTNDKRGSGSLAVFMTYRQWGDSMYGMFGRNAIIDSLDQLIGEQLVAREPYKMHGKDTFQYYLNYREVNRRLKALPERTPNQKLPQGFYDPFAGEADEETGLLVNATGLLINATGLLVNDDPFTSNHNVDTTQNPLSINTESSTTRLRADHNGPSDFENGKEEKTPSQKEGKVSNPSPPAEETRGETPNARLKPPIFTEDEQAVWAVVCQARELLIAERAKQYGYAGEKLEAWQKPTKAQREQVSKIVAILGDYHLALGNFTPLLIRQAWEYAVETKKFLDTVWKLGNLERELPVYLAFHKPAAPQKPVEAPESSEDLNQSVLWTRTPSKIRQMTATGHDTIEDHRQYLEWMPLSDAREYDYGMPGVRRYTEQEIEIYQQLTEQGLKIAG
jgi:hypothetical protein